jgi:transcriptional regulator with XRE-family HTH domain
MVGRLRKLQGNKNQREFASELGLSQSQLSRLYTGERGIGLRTAQLIVQRYPELALDMATFLLSKNRTDRPSD